VPSAQRKKPAVAAGFGRKNEPVAGKFFWFIYLIRAGDDMHKYSNQRAQKQRVLHE
jgi:hypothetical protein